MKKVVYIATILVVGLLGFVGWTVNAQLQKGSAARQAWEYRNVVFTIDAFDRQTMYEDGKQVSAAATPLSKMPDLGAEGWELVSVTSTSKPVGSGSMSTNVYWLKRPK